MELGIGLARRIAANIAKLLELQHKPEDK